MAAVKLRDTIFECLRQAQSDSDEAKLKALQTLVSITKVSPLNRNMVAQADGAIPMILDLFKSSSLTLHTLSLAILFNLSLNPNLKLSLANIETIQSLNSVILSSNSQETSKLAASLICSLAMLDKNKAMFGVANTIQSLVKAVSGPHGPAAHHILSSLAELVQFHGNCTLAVRAGAVGAMLNIVESRDGDDLAGTALAVVSLLARFDEGLHTLRKTEQIVSIMLEVLKGRCMLSKEGAAEVLLRLFDESEGCVRDALRLPEFPSVLADLSVRGSSKAREKASFLMRKMMEVDSESYHEETTTTTTTTTPLFSRW